jgi:hypothetical protein
MKSSQQNLNDIMEEFEAGIKGDWNTPRAKLYIASNLFEARRCAEKAVMDLEFEKAVNKRVQELLREAFVERTATQELRRINPSESSSSV